MLQFNAQWNHSAEEYKSLDTFKWQRDYINNAYPHTNHSQFLKWLMFNYRMVLNIMYLEACQLLIYSLHLNKMQPMEN